MYNNIAARNTELGRTIFNLTNRNRALEAEKLQLAYDCGTERQEHERQRRREAERTAQLENQVVHLQAKLCDVARRH